MAKASIAVSAVNAHEVSFDEHDPSASAGDELGEKYGTPFALAPSNIEWVRCLGANVLLTAF